MAHWLKELQKLKNLEPPGHLWSRVEASVERPQVLPTPARARLAAAAVALGVTVVTLTLLVRTFAEVESQPGGQRHDSVSVTNGSIAFVTSVGDGRVGIGVVDPKDGRITSLSNPGQNEIDLDPVWSPDGKMIAFIRYTNVDPESGRGDYEVFVSQADGSMPMNLTGDSGGESPAWSPTGNQLAFVRGSGNTDIWVSDADGTNKRSLNTPGGLFPSWSPVGDRIAYVDRDGGISVVGVESGRATRIVDAETQASRPMWSPDGERLAFTGLWDGRIGVLVGEADGSGIAMAADVATRADDCCIGDPVWSPDGSQLAFDAQVPGGHWDIFVADVSTGESMRLTNGPGDERTPTWSPDGSMIAYEASEEPALGTEGKPSDVYVVTVLGGVVTRLTEGGLAGSSELSWQRVPAG